MHGGGGGGQTPGRPGTLLGLTPCRSLSPWRTPLARLGPGEKPEDTEQASQWVAQENHEERVSGTHFKQAPAGPAPGRGHTSGSR